MFAFDSCRKDHLCLRFCTVTAAELCTAFYDTVEEHLSLASITEPIKQLILTTLWKQALATDDLTEMGLKRGYILSLQESFNGICIVMRLSLAW